MTFYRKYKWLQPMLVFTGAMIATRMVLTGSISFIFINWNLFLAGLPLYFGYMLNHRADTRARQVLFLGLWLLFFPNSPYIITDLFHLDEAEHMPAWYDLLLLFSAAITGLLMAFLSLMEAERFIAPRLTARRRRFAVLAAFMLCGYGIYLGRYGRWNSWDIITQPYALACDIAMDLRHPLRHFECWMLTVLFGAWMYMIYRYFKRVSLRNCSVVE